MCVPTHIYMLECAPMCSLGARRASVIPIPIPIPILGVPVSDRLCTDVLQLPSITPTAPVYPYTHPYLPSYHPYSPYVPLHTPIFAALPQG